MRSSAVLLVAFLGCAPPGPGTSDRPLEGVPFYPMKPGYTWISKSNAGRTFISRIVDVQGDRVIFESAAGDRVTPEGVLVEKWREVSVLARAHDLRRGRGGRLVVARVRHRSIEEGRRSI